jgi:hypothetical protein
MLFDPSHRKEPLSISVKIEDQQIDLVQQTKCLGIILDNKLNWKNHISYLTQKIAKSIGILSRARQLLNFDTLKQLYYSFLYPYLYYCNVIWGQASDSAVWPLFKLQKREIRIICNIRRRESSLAAFSKLNILRLLDIHKFSILSKASVYLLTVHQMSDNL